MMYAYAYTFMCVCVLDSLHKTNRNELSSRVSLHSQYSPHAILAGMDWSFKV